MEALGQSGSAPPIAIAHVVVTVNHRLAALVSEVVGRLRVYGQGPSITDQVVTWTVLNTAWHATHTLALLQKKISFKTFALSSSLEGCIDALMRTATPPERADLSGKTLARFEAWCSRFIAAVSTSVNSASQMNVRATELTLADRPLTPFARSLTC